MNIALLTAAGVGSRMNLDIPKQFLHINDKPILIYTLEKFQKHPNIDKIIVVTLESWIDVVWSYAKQFDITKLQWVVPGGSTGQESIKCGLDVLRNECHVDDTVIIHDGNRCNVSSEIISNSLAVYKDKGNAVAVIPCVEAVFKSEDGLSSNETIPREELWRTQTPHTFRLKDLLWAHEMAAEYKIINMAATCSLFQALGKTIHFSKGAETNLKITTQEDLEIFKALLYMQKGATN